MSVWREVQEAIYQRFKDGWVTGDPSVPLTPFCFENEDGFDPPKAPWARVTCRRLTGGNGTLGPKGHRKMDRVGQLFIQIFEPPGNGTGNLSDLGEFAAGLFENCRFEPHDIRFAAVEPGDQGDFEKGRWRGLSVEGRFDYEQLN